MREIRGALFEMRDEQYRDFHSGLIPNIDPRTIIGVRTPELRKLAKKLAGSDKAEDFLRILPHEYYEENNLHAFLIEQIRDFDACIRELELFLPYVDNWATCDMLSPKVFVGEKDKLIVHIRRWLDSEYVYAVRFGVDMLMKHYLQEDFKAEYLDWVSEIRSGEYYLRMVQAWYFATALTKQYDAALPYIKERKLERWTHNKAIQKARESRCISDAHKQELYAHKWK